MSSVSVGGLFKNNGGKDEKKTQNKKHKEIQMKDVITIRFKTVSPLLQMDSEGKQRKRYVFEDGHFYKDPFWSANGFRGALRRAATRTLGEAVQKKNSDFKFDAENMYLYASGAGADRKSIENVTPEIEAKVREKAPILSLFGAGLSQIAGKTAVSDIRVSKHQLNDVEKYRFIKSGDNEFAVSNFIEEHTYYRDDVATKQGMLSELIDQEQISKWVKEHYAAVMIAKEKKKEDANLKESVSHMQQPVSVECIVPNTIMTTSINPINYSKFNDVELGCLVKALTVLAPQQIGAAKRYGYGMLDWQVRINDELLFELERDSDFISNYILSLSDKAKGIIAVYDEWLDKNATDESIDIKNIIKECSK